MMKEKIMGLQKEDYLKLYSYLQQTRVLEDFIYYICANQNPKNPLIIGKGYLSTGQEAVSIGAVYSLKNKDWLAQSHRDFGALLLRGFTIDDLLAQYLSRASSPTKGRDANVHLGDTSKHVLGFISHMGAMLPVANGIASAAKYRNDHSVCLAFFGDGASSQGIVHEAMNYAAVFKLAVVFICNNNRWAISTPLHEQMIIKDVADRAVAYGMPGQVCDGNNVIEVYDAVNDAVLRARAGAGPSLIECKTMRMAGHGTHDRTKFNSDAEMLEWAAKDPIKKMESILIEKQWADEEYFKVVTQECKLKVDEALARVKEIPGPTSENEVRDVYA